MSISMLLSSWKVFVMFTSSFVPVSFFHLQDTCDLTFKFLLWLIYGRREFMPTFWLTFLCLWQYVCSSVKSPTLLCLLDLLGVEKLFFSTRWGEPTCFRYKAICRPLFMTLVYWPIISDNIKVLYIWHAG